MNNLQKGLAIVLLCVVGICVLGSCSASNNSEDCTFTLISREDGISLYRDNATDVMYVFIYSDSEGGATVMVEEDGSPLTYSEWVKRLK